MRPTAKDHFDAQRGQKSVFTAGTFPVVVYQFRCMHCEHLSPRVRRKLPVHGRRTCKACHKENILKPDRIFTSMGLVELGTGRLAK